MMRLAPLAVLTFLAPVPVAAAEANSAQVAISAADFGSKNAVSKFEHRVRSAIEEVCGSYAAVEPSQVPAMDACWDAARAQVNRQLADRNYPAPRPSKPANAAPSNERTADVQASDSSPHGDVLPRYAQWERRLRARVNERLVYPFEVQGPSGDVLVGFAIGADGAPTHILVHRSSGNPALDEAALRLVSELGRIGPVPSAGSDVDEVILKLSYGDPSRAPAASIEVARADRGEQLANECRKLTLVLDEARFARCP